MKKLFKLFTFCLMFLPCAFLLLGCSNYQNDKYVGTYKVVSFNSSELVVTREQYLSNPSNYDEWDISGWFEMTIYLNKSGNFEQRQQGVNYIQRGTWKVSGNNIIVSANNEVYMTFYIFDDDTLTYQPYIEYSDTTTITLNKQ